VDFKLTMSLDNAEAAEAPWLAVAKYLREIAAGMEEGYDGGVIPAQPIRDGNGNTIGHYEITG
jgi:hypothetical protein